MRTFLNRQVNFVTLRGTEIGCRTVFFMETELWTRWVGPSRIGYFVRRNACYLSLSCTEVSKTVEQLLGLFKWIDGALFDSFLKGKKSPAVSISGFNRNSNLCWTLYTLQFRTKIRFMFYFPDVMYREILTDFSSSSFFCTFIQMPFLYGMYLYTGQTFLTFLLRYRTGLVIFYFYAPSVSFSDEGLEF